MSSLAHHPTKTDSISQQISSFSCDPEILAWLDISYELLKVEFIECVQFIIFQSYVLIVIISISNHASLNQVKVYTAYHFQSYEHSLKLA